MAHRAMRRSLELDKLNALGVGEQVILHSLSPWDFRSVMQVLEKARPDEIYNLSGQSSVALSFTQPTETIESIIFGTLNLLEAMRMVGPQMRLYNAGSSESFGDITVAAADELTAFRPKSPYGVAKAASVSLVANYRESYRLFACSGILFNHELPLRPERFVTRKITAAAARIAGGSGERLLLGNLSTRRDFGWAPDYVVAMWRMLNLERAEDIVIATGQSHSLEEFVAAAFDEVGLDWRKYVDIDPGIGRPSDITYSCGNATRAREVLGWHPTATFHDIVRLMMRAEREGPGSIS